MSSVISNKVQSYVFSSNPALGATNISADGSSFSISLDSPIEVPRGVIDCTLDVIAASIWNVSPNIKAAYNNDKFYFSHLGTPYIVTIETGLYSLPQLNSYFRRYFVNNGLPNNLIVLSANDSAQTCIITFNYVGTQIDFTQLNTVRTILGFNSELLPNGGPSTIIGESYEGESKASFNRINFYYIKSSLVNQGLSINGISGNIIAQVPITAAPGSQINYQPQNVIAIQARGLIGNPRQQITFQLLDDQLRSVDNLGQFWSVTIEINSQLLLSTVNLPLVP